MDVEGGGGRQSAVLTLPMTTVQVTNLFTHPTRCAQEKTTTPSINTPQILNTFSL